MSLDDNRGSSFQTRELKSVHVDCVCRFVRVLVHRNHINELNLYNQVTVVVMFISSFTSIHLSGRHHRNQHDRREQLGQ